MDEAKKREMRRWIAAVKDSLHAAQSIAGRASEAMEQTDGFAPLHDLMIAIGKFAEDSPEIAAAISTSH